MRAIRARVGRDIRPAVACALGTADLACRTALQARCRPRSEIRGDHRERQAARGQCHQENRSSRWRRTRSKTASGSGVRLVLSIAGLLFGATGAFVSLQESLNRARADSGTERSGRCAVRRVRRHARAGTELRRGTRQRSDAVMQVQRETAETRDRMSGTVRAIESRAGEVADDVKETLTPAGLVRADPWPVLAVAIVAGVALSATRTDHDDGTNGTDGTSGEPDAPHGVVGRAKASV